MNEPWKINVLGELRAERDGQSITRFRTQKAASLLAYLAYFQKRPHPREKLIDLLWPDSDMEAGRANLRTALASLRRQLEPPGVAMGSVIVADRVNLRLNPAAACVDVALFEDALRNAAQEGMDDPERRIAQLEQALALYTGDLLPSFYDDWVITERERLAQIRLKALCELAERYEAAGDLVRALDYAHQATLADEYHDEARELRDRLLTATGRSLADISALHFGERAAVGSGKVSVRRARHADEQASRHRTESGNSGSGTATLAPPVPTKTTTTGKPTPPRAPTPRPRLPLTFTSFFGREEENRRIEEALRTQATRLITLTGPGGSGKTRLAIEAARRREGLFGDAIWFVPLADVDDARHIPGALLKALQIPASPQADPLEQIAAALGDRPALFVLDNFEQLAVSGASLVRELLVRVPTLVCLITSREPLGLEGEREIPVNPLPVPSLKDTPERLMECASVQLFVDRAQAIRPDFTVTPRNAEFVARLCEWLDGIPLALELAAAQIRALTPTQVLSQIQSRLDLLTSQRRDLPDRHRALRATIDWSYNLLPPDLKQLFTRLSVFRGGFTAEAAQEVCVEAASDGALLYRLSSLSARSLLRTEESGAEMRYRMLETLREFAQEQLGEDHAVGEERHRHYFRTLTEKAAPNLRLPAEREAWMDLLETEHSNLRAALTSALATSDIETGLQMAGNLWRFWWMRGYPTEGRQHLAAFLAHSVDCETPARAEALNGAGNLAHSQGDYAASVALQEEALTLWRKLGNESGIAAVLSNLAMARFYQGDYPAARAMHTEALAIFQRIGNTVNAAVALNGIGNVAYREGNLTEARTFYEQSLTLYRAMEDQRGISWLLHNLGNVASDAGDFDAAREYYHEALDLKRELGDHWGVASTLHCLGNVAASQNDYASARPYYEECAALYRQWGDKSGLALALVSLANAAGSARQFKAAHGYLNESLAVSRDSGDRHAMGNALQCAAILAALEKQPARAVRLWAVADTLYRQMGVTAIPTIQATRDAKLSELRGMLGETFQAAWAEGEALVVEEEGVDYAMGAPFPVPAAKF